MPLSAKKAAASYSSGGVRVPRAPLVSCLTCPLCTNLFREATTISECLHTFCRECIRSCLSDGETNSCPMCNVSLGTGPMEKLRADHQLEDVKVKIFPDVSRKRKTGPGSSPAAISSAANIPMRRRERSLYSLGIGVQPSLANPGFVTRTTRRSSGKSVAGRDSSSSDDNDDNDEDEDEDQDDDDADADDDDEEDHEADEMEDEDEEQTEDDEGGPDKVHHIGSGYHSDHLASSPNAAGTGTTRGSEFELDSYSDEDMLPPRPSRAKEEPRRAPLKDAAMASPMGTSDSGLYIARRSVLTANGFSQSGNARGGIAIAAGVGPLENSVLPVGGNLSQEAADNLLATLAEVAGADSTPASRALKLNQAEQPHLMPHGQAAASPELSQARDANNDAKTMETLPSSQGTSRALGGATSLHPSPPRARRSSPQLQRNPSLKLFVNGVERPAILKHPTQPPPPANGSHVTSTSFVPSSCGIWSDNPLPQLSSPYLRIKDGKLPVSHVKKYLAKKLGLNNETEVEITCRGQPVVSSLPLESVRNIWFATAAVPNSKDQEDQGQTAAASETVTTGLVHLDKSSARELIMVLTYQRHRRNSRIC